MCDFDLSSSDQAMRCGGSLEMDNKDNYEKYKSSLKKEKNEENTLNRMLFDQMIASSNAAKKYFKNEAK